MNIKYPDSVKTPNGDVASLQSVSSQLEQIAGKSAIPASAEWEVIQNPQGNRRYLLKLWDYTGQVAEEFTPAELRSPKEMRGRLIHLWGDMLQVRSHRLLKKLTEGTEE
jgi:hypothetical protein